MTVFDIHIGDYFKWTTWVYRLVSANSDHCIVVTVGSINENNELSVYGDQNETAFNPYAEIEAVKLMVA